MQANPNTLTRSAVLGLAILGGCMLVLSTIQSPSAQASMHDGDDKEHVIQATKAFYSALTDMLGGDPEPFKEVWWHDKDIMYMGADGSTTVGWERIYANWSEQAEQSIGGSVRHGMIGVILGEDVATSYTEVIASDSHGKHRLRSTSTFRKRDGQWRMVGHHVDVLPWLQKQMHGG